MTDFDTDTLRGAACAFGFAATLISREPDEDWVRRCIDGRMFDATPFGEDDAAVHDGLAKMASWCEGARGDIAQATADIRREWLRLFVGLGAPQAPVWESYYVEPNSTMFGRSTLEARAAYKEWGLAFERRAHEPDDALGIMLAFCAHLMERELEAIDAYDAPAAGKAASALKDFMVRHMLPWASAWRFLVARHATSDYYRGAGELVFGIERAYARRFGVACDESDGTFSYARG